MTKRSRGWLFTLNNYTEEEVVQLRIELHSYTVEKWIFGYEVGPTCGTPHLQGYIYYKDGRSFERQTKINKRISWKRAMVVQMIIINIVVKIKILNVMDGKLSVNQLDLADIQV